jgi:hypothetical protein
MIVAPFQYEDMHLLTLQPAQSYLSGWVSEIEGRALEEHPSYTGWHEGVPIVSAGIIPQWQGRAIAWAFLAEVPKPVMIAVHRAVRDFLDGCYIQRIETSVRCDFPEGHRWATMLGFKMEAECMRAYGADGSDAALYARVR